MPKQKPKSKINAAPAALTDGLDSGSVADKVKTNLFAAQLGICAAPKCDNRIHVNKTRLGECAHIIPKKVGSHPREDYKTPLEDRRLEPNLLYLCEGHHKFIDNKDLATQYPADLLRQWKTEHEKWAAQVRKEATYLSADLEAKLQSAIAVLGEGATQSKELISKLLQTCREQISHGRLLEANALFSQVELLVSALGDPELTERTNIIAAVLEYKAENVHKAKEHLLEIIQNNTEAHDAMFEYIDICETAPEPGDSPEKFEQTVTTLLPGHPRLKMLAAVRAYRTQETAKVNASDEFPVITDPLLKHRFFIQKAIVYDVAEEKDKRDALLDQASVEFPNSPRINLFRFVFKAVDTLRSNPSQVALEECLFFSEEEMRLAQGKDPLIARDHLAWDFHKFLVQCELLRLFGVEKNLDETAEELLNTLSGCFADRNILAILNDVLHIVQVPEDKLVSLFNILTDSKVVKPPELLQLMLLQGLAHPAQYKVIREFMNEEGMPQYTDILDAVINRDANKVAESANKVASDDFNLGLLHFLNDKKFASEVSARLTVGDEGRQSFIFSQIETLTAAGKPEDAIKLISDMEIGLLTPGALKRIAAIAYQQGERRLFIHVAEKLCGFDLPKAYKTELLTKLALMAHKEGDAATAVRYGEQALEDLTEMKEQNARLIIWVCADSYYLMGRPEKACEIFGEKNVPPTFEFKLVEAQFILRTTRPEKIEQATTRVLEGFLLAEAFDDRTFVSAFGILNEVNKAPNTIGLSTAEPGCFVKLEDLGWIYLGNLSHAMGATAITTGDSYDAIIGKAGGGQVFWPPDKYASPGKQRKIIHILTPLGYLAARAHEGLENLAKLGTEQIWTVQALKEDGTLDLDNITAFLKDQLRNSNEFFETYTTNVLPFGFLAAVEHDLVKAISKISSEGKGFIRCNNGTSADIQRQAGVAESVLTGAPCVMDGLVALMLAESGLLQAVIEAVPHMSVPLSVISYLRKFASDLDPTSTSEGRGGLIGGNLRFTPRAVDRERDLHGKLIEASALLDGLPNKTIGRLIREDEEESSLAKSMPPCLTEPFNIALDKEAYLLTDDGVMPQAYELTEGHKAPKHFSSLALVKALVDKRLIPLADYLHFFSLLAGYRYHLLPISVGDLVDTVMHKTAGGFITVEPRNIEFLQLQLTLSADYGVNETVALRILSLFFGQLITDDTVPEDVVDSIFAYAIIRFFGQRESRLQAEVIKEVCKRQLGDERWLSRLTKKKYEILVKQLSKFSETYDPVFAAMPILMKTIRR